MNKPLVTIITPVYNCAEFVGETVKGVFRQDYPNINYIVIDDASTDSPAFPLGYPETHSFEGHVKIISHEANQGEQCTVNEGLKLVKGKYFMIVNADDPLLPGAVSKLVAFMEANPDVLCGYPNYNVIGEDGKVRWRVTSREYDFRWMVRHHTWIPSVGSIFRSDVIEEIGYRDTSFRWLGDADYWLQVGLIGKMAHIPETLACWRKRNGQASSSRDQLRAREHIRVIQKFYSARFLPDKLLNIRNEAICWSYLVAAAVTSSNLEVLQYAAEAVIAYPRLLVDIKFWDLFLKRAYFILRR